MNLRFAHHLNGANWQRRRSGAFTLIEVMISAALMSMILVSAYVCLGAGFSAQKLIEPRSEVLQNARVALAIMTADLRAACPLSKDDDFLGMTRTVEGIEADNLDFGTHNYTPHHDREGDFCQESYYLDKDPETGHFSLMRRRNPTIALDALAGGSKEEIAQGVLGLKLEYYDGTDWYDSWGQVKAAGKDQNSAKDQGNLSGLPTAVRITLFMDPNPGKKTTDASTGETRPAVPMVFKTLVFLNLAESSQPASDSSGTSDAGNASAPGQPNGGNH